MNQEELTCVSNLIQQSVPFKKQIIIITLNMNLESSLHFVLLMLTNKIIDEKKKSHHQITTTVQESSSAINAYLVEQFRSERVEELRKEIESLVKPHINIIYSNNSNNNKNNNNSSTAIPYNLFRKNMNSLFPNWALTAANFEWKRDESLKQPQQENEKDLLLPTRDWIAPLLDGGCQVIEKASSSSSSQEQKREGILSEWKMGKNTDEDIFVTFENDKEETKVKLSDFILVEPKQFCRDALIPSNEDEPAGRCGNSALFTKLAMSFKMNTDLVCDLVQKISRCAEAARVNIWKFERSLSKNENRNNENYIVKLVVCNSASSSLSHSTVSTVDDVVLGIELGKQEDDPQPKIIAQLSSFHLLKLRLLYLNNLQTSSNNESAAAVLKELEAIRTSLEGRKSTFVDRGEEQQQQYTAPCWFATVKDDLKYLENNNNNQNITFSDFLLRIATVLQRYQTLDGGPSSASYSNMHAAIHPDFVREIGLAADNSSIESSSLTKTADSNSTSTSFFFNVKFECFANPFNTGTCRFGSLFFDTDCHFGSLGSFWNWDFNQIMSSQNHDDDEKDSFFTFEMNPPFESNTVRRAVNKLFARMEQHLSSTLSDSILFPPLTVLIVLPEPQIKTAEGKKFLQVFTSLEESKFCLCQKSLEGNECAYVQGNQQHMNETTTSASSATISLKAVTLSAPTRLFVLSSSNAGVMKEKLTSALSSASEAWKEVSLKISKLQEAENTAAAGMRRQR